MMLFSVVANDEQGHQNVSSGHKSAAQHGPGRQQSSPNQTGFDHNGLSGRKLNICIRSLNIYEMWNTIFYLL